MAATPFTISISDSEIDKLHKKLDVTSFPDEVDSDDQWPYGSPLTDVKKLATYWKDKFDWKDAETKLNKLPNYTTAVDVDHFGPVNLHFVHQLSPVEAAIPLLFVHGWPGSFIEVTKLLPLLSESSSKTPAFHVVAPSLPNFGFSQGIKKPGFGLEQYAETCHKLMQSLGYNEYVTQGGDWGTFITRTMGLLYPAHVKASHINMVRANPPSFTCNPLLAIKHAVSPYSRHEQQGFARTQWFMKEGVGYNKEQSTKPQTIGYALADSPVALLAWIYEKLHDWTDSYPWTEEEILTWISIYWFSTAGPAASVRIYYEATHTKGRVLQNREALASWIPHVKLGVAYFPRELTVFPKTWARTLGPVVYESDNESGGHFAAHERPQVIAGDLKNMFGKGGPCYGAVKRKDGYENSAARL